MRHLEIDAQVAQRAVAASDQRHGQHPAVEHELRAAAVDGQRPEPLHGDPDAAGLRLVVVRDVVLPLDGPRLVEVVTSGGKTEHGRLPAGVFGSDPLQRPADDRPGIAPVAGAQPEIGDIVDALRMQTGGREERHEEQ